MLRFMGISESTMSRDLHQLGKEVSPFGSNVHGFDNFTTLRVLMGECMISGKPDENPLFRPRDKTERLEGKIPSVV